MLLVRPLSKHHGDRISCPFRKCRQPLEPRRFVFGRAVVLVVLCGRFFTWLLLGVPVLPIPRVTSGHHLDPTSGPGNGRSCSSSLVQPVSCQTYRRTTVQALADTGETGYECTMYPGSLGAESSSERHQKFDDWTELCRSTNGTGTSEELAGANSDRRGDASRQGSCSFTWHIVPECLNVLQETALDDGRLNNGGAVPGPGETMAPSGGGDRSSSQTMFLSPP